MEISRITLHNTNSTNTFTDIAKSHATISGWNDAYLIKGSTANENPLGQLGTILEITLILLFSIFFSLGK